MKADQNADQNEGMVVARWGWESPPAAITEQAKQVVAIGGDVGRALEVVVGLEAQVVARLRASCPRDKELLAFAVQELPGKVQPFVEAIQALAHGFPFYEQLGVLEKHPEMKVGSSKGAGVHSRCEKLDCALMLVEAARPVLVFSSFQAMMQFQMTGRAERAGDPLFAAVGDEMPLLAVGGRDDISAIIARSGGDAEAYASDNERIWNSNSTETKEHPEQRELVRLLDHAIDSGASDISLAPRRDGSYRLLVRKYGSLVEPRSAASWAPELAAKIIQVLETKSGANPTGTSYREPRDGHISYRSSVGDAFLRLSFIPRNHRGDVKNRKSVSIRLFSNTEARVDLDALGLPEEAVSAIDAGVRMPSGLVLLVGPMNSGKSSTIAAAMGRHAAIYGPTKKRVSIEDPIERYVEDCTQIEIPGVMRSTSGALIGDNERFNIILRGSKRHDINVYWIGEVRDAESAAFCVSIASSGHLGLSTLHAKNAIIAFDILSKMVDADLRFQLAESLTTIISQRLIPGLCEHCKVRKKTTAEEKAQWKLYMQMEGESEALPGLIWRSTPHSESGCDKCENGYFGYRPVCEVLTFTRSVRDAAFELLDGGAAAKIAREKMASERALTLIQSGLRLLKKGEVDLQSIIHM